MIYKLVTIGILTSHVHPYQTIAYCDYARVQILISKLNRKGWGWDFDIHQCVERGLTDFP
ncbi:hypothetical protein GTO27_07520 [Candidatus Bathyarchaeota archaeon]|nr:hypothetical protein [Candidatus Bathyarchaeota archaeon]